MASSPGQQAASKRARRPPARFELEHGMDAKDAARVRAATDLSRKSRSMSSLVLPEAPVFRPTEEEFADPCTYLAKIAHYASRYGIAKIVPPVGWNPPCTIAAREASNVKYKTRLQAIHSLQEGLPFPDGNIYTFSEYKLMADAFKQNNFPHLVPRSTAQAAPADDDGDIVSIYVDEGEGSAGSAPKRPRWEASGAAAAPAAEADECGGVEEVISLLLADEATRSGGGGDALTYIPAVAPRGAEDPAAPPPSPYARMARAVEAAYWGIVERGGAAAAAAAAATAAAAASGGSGSGAGTAAAAPAARQQLQQVYVEYGNDQDSREVGSGFPRLGEHHADAAAATAAVGGGGGGTTALPAAAVAAAGSAEFAGNTGTGVSAAEARFLSAAAAAGGSSAGGGGAAAGSGSDEPFPESPQAPGPPPAPPRLRSSVPPRWGDPAYYAESPWNLNNLPFLPRSLLRHVNEEINGVNVPWIYLGMLFSSFAWHNEDHHLYSINYMHAGEGKTWYGVPGLYAPEFERGVRRVLFDRAKEADLLYHITTMLSPAQLSAESVPVYRCFQEPGEFIITFPASYHAGFSHGWNMAEACNFALPDWLSWGRRAVEKYRHTTSLRALCFSHEQLLCNLARHTADHVAAVAAVAAAAHGGDSGAAGAGGDDGDGGGGDSSPQCTTSQPQLAAIRDELAHLVAVEGRERLAVQQGGVALAVHLPNEGDPRYECVRCRQICYLSAVICRCSAGAKRRVSCLRHVRHLCACEPASKVLVYWYRLEDLQALLAGVQATVAAAEARPAVAAAAVTAPA